jgi:nitrogen regulatory protein PII
MSHAPKSIVNRLPAGAKLSEKMKRIELVIEPSALDRFSETAHTLNLADFDVTEVRRTPSAHRKQRQRLYRGHEFTLDLVDRLKVELTVGDEPAGKIARTLIAGVNPESIAILRLEDASLVNDAPRATMAPVASKKGDFVQVH